MENLLESNSFYWIVLYLAIGKIVLGIFWTILMKHDHLLSHRVYKVEIPDGQKAREYKNSWHVISDGVALYLLVYFDLISFAESTLTTTITTFLIFYAWVETWYYFTHRLMHKYDWLYKYHRMHHLSLVVTPLSSISMSNVEKIGFYTGGWLGFMALISWWVPVSLYGIVAYYTYHFIVSLHGHSNTEASAMNSLLAKAGMGSATSHAIHHARFRKNYGFSNMFWDRVFGTYAEDTIDMQERAIKKDGTTSIKTILKTN